MEKEKLLNILKQTLADYRFSRGEKKTIKEFVQHYFSTPHDLAVLRSEAFELAREELVSPQSKEVMDWLEDVLKVMIPSHEALTIESEAVFSTEHNCVTKLQGLIANTRKSLEICVFTITDDRISDEIMAAARRRVKVRIISDDEKAHDSGSDIYRLKSFGIPVRTDRNPNHMHHKFALFDSQRLLNGSYNWTRSAANHNEENFVICNDPKLTSSFTAHFEELWEKFHECR